MKKRADGRYRKTITIDGIKRSFYGKSEREVNRKILEFEREKEQGRPFSKVADEWWEDAYDQIAENSVRNYKVAYRRAVEYFGDMSVNDITPRAITMYLTSLARIGLGEKVIKSHKMVVSLILKTAMFDGDLEFNAATAARMPQHYTRSVKRTQADRTDEARILSAEDANRDFPVALIALLTGMRRGEILGLQRGDIDFDAGVIHVRRSVVYRGTATVKDPKTDAGFRDVPLLPQMAEFLRVYADMRADEYLIHDELGRPITNRMFESRWRKYVAATGISCTPHNLRHSFASIIAAADVNPTVAKTILGHSNIAVTMDTYTHLRSEKLKEEADKISASFFEPKS